MLFNSLAFACFLPVVLALWYALPRRRRLVMLGASYVFYANWEPAFLLLLLFSTGLDYVIGRGLEREQAPRVRRLLLAASLTGNLGLLVYFKYWLVIWAAATGQEAAGQHFHVEGFIPPGISFYTFQTVSYTIDVYRRRSPACRSLLDFAVYVSFFPQLVAGPVVRGHEFFPQLAAGCAPTRPELIQGVELFALGLFKKVAIADNLAVMVDAVYAEPQDHTGGTLWLATMLFAAQIYADFSGYSTMARGLARFFGFTLPRNFDSPWLAGGVKGYHRTWHITMGRWFRDYIYFPLGGSRGAQGRVALNLMIVWGLFGVWHGAAWTFMAWGLYNGAVQVAVRVAERAGLVIPEFRGRFWAGSLFAWIVLMPGVAFFRSEGMGSARVVLTRMLAFAGDGGHDYDRWWWAMLGLAAVHAAFKVWYREDALNRMGPVGRALLLGVAAFAVLALAPEQRPFVYFQF